MTKASGPAARRTRPRGRRAAGDTLTEQRFVALGRLAGSIVHDFNNLLLVMTGHVELARRLLGEGHPASERLLPVLQASERAASFTRHLLAFGRRAASPGGLADVSAALSDLSPLLERLLGPYVRVDLRTGRGLGLVRTEPAQLEQLLLNLALNARDAMPSGGRLRIEAQDVEIAGGTAPEAPPGRYVLLVVEDEGVGMDAAVRARAFEPFFTTKDAGAGSGLGLSTVERVVREAGGTIRVDSQPGRGTTFRVYLPWAAEPGAAPPPDDGVAAPSGLETVLLADGSPEARAVTAELLASLGYTVLQASSAEEALRLARERREPLDLLLVDAEMPGEGGGRLFEQLAAARPHARGLLMSSTPLAPLSKPFTRLRLARAVRAALDRGAA